MKKDGGVPARQKRKELRLSDSEFLRLQFVADQLDITSSAFIRAAVEAQYFYLSHNILNRPRVIILDDKTATAIQREQLKLGRNFNQGIRGINELAKIFREHDMSDFGEGEIAYATQHLGNIKKLLTEVRENALVIQESIETVAAPVKSSRWKRKALK